MKKGLWIAVIWLISLGGYAQSTFNIPFDTLIQLCPPDSSYLYLFADTLGSTTYTADSVNYSPESIGGTNVSMSDDQVLGPYNIGFEFTYFCNTYTQFYIGSNGWIGFTSGQTTSWVVQTIPNTATNRPHDAILGPWKDWNPGTGNGPYISYQVQGSAPCRKLVVTWNGCPMFSCTSSLGTFQIVLNETSNIIDNHLINVPVCNNWGNGDGTQGIHNLPGTIGVVASGRNDNSWVATGESWRYTPQGTIQWTYPNGSSAGTGNCVTVYPLQSTWVFAQGVTCSGDTLNDSVYIAVSCLYLEMDSSDVQCTGDSTGYAVAVDTSVYSGTSPPYTFIWMNTQGDTLAINNSTDSIDTLFNAPAGDYICYAFDATGEIATGFTSINEPDTAVAVTNMIPVLCNGDATGKIIAIDTGDYSNISSWDGFYSYFWDDGGGVFDSTILSTNSSDTVSGVSAGIYQVTIDGCKIYTGTVTVTEPPVLTSSITNPTKISCPGSSNCDASATANGFGGVSPYFYLWSSGEVSQTANNLCADTNWVTVTDNNGCESESFVIIDVPDSIITSSFGDTLICITNPAAIAAASIGGSAPFNYVWRRNSLNGQVVSTSAAVTVYPSVTTRYFVYSTDSNGCPGDTASTLIKVRPPLGLELPLVDTICPYDTIDVTVAGLGGDTNYTYAWSSGVFGATATISPDLPQWYTITVSDACGTPTYTDSVWVQVGGYSPIDVKIRVEDDSICIGENVYLIASGRGGHRGPREYIFKWSETGMDGNPIQFVTPSKTKQYSVSISDLCLSPEGSDTLTVHVQDPVAPKFTAKPAISCTDADVLISIDEFNPNWIYSWEFGDGEQALNFRADSILHRFIEPGCYDVTLKVATDFGCFAQRDEKCFVKILQAPTANFYNIPLQPTTMDPILRFTDQSKNASSWIWYLDGDTLAENKSLFFHEFIDTGFYEVSLVAISDDGCIDTLTKTLHHSLETTMYIPTSFTPNGDGRNDVFRIEGEALDPDGFEFVIFDRWGHQLFYTKNPAFGWDGKYSTTGEVVPNGVYPYILRYRDAIGQLKKMHGQIVVSVSGGSTSLK